MIVSAYNPETEELEKTYLSSFVSSGSSVLPVKNNDRFAADQMILVGAMGGEKTEVAQIDSVDIDKLEITLTDPLDFDHNADTMLYKLEFDQIRFYRRTSENATPVLVHTSAIDVDNADKITRWDDPSSMSSYFYQYAWYNSITDEESDLSDKVQATGYTRKNIGAIIDGVVRRVRDVGFSVLTFDEYLDIANEVGDDLITQAQKPYTFLNRSIKLDTVAGQNYIDILDVAPEFFKFDYVEVGEEIGANRRYRQVTPLSFEQFQIRYNETNQIQSDRIQDVAFDPETKRLYIYPTPQTTKTEMFVFHYYKFFTELTSASQSVETPNPTIYRYKLMAEYYSAKSEADKQWAVLANTYENKYGNEIVKLQRANRLDVGTPRSFRPPRTYRRRRFHL